jgi:uridine kinase
MHVTQAEQIGIRAAAPRKTVQVTIKNTLILEGSIGTTIESFLIEAGKTDKAIPPDMLMGGIVDGRLRELAYPITRDVVLDPVLLTSSDGGRIYRRSLVMLLATAVDELWPGIQVSVSYAIPEGGFYCQMLNRPQLSDDELEQLEQQMRAIVNPVCSTQ